MLPVLDPLTAIFVTGGTGMVGRAVLVELQRLGFSNVTAIYRSGYSQGQLKDIQVDVKWVEGDILDIVGLEEILQDCKVIIHCAAIISFHPRDRWQMMHTNVEGTANLVDLAIELGIPRFIHVSSVAAIGRQPQLSLIDEHSIWNASNRNSAYSRSKFQGEQEVWRGMAEGLSVAIVNPSIIIGGKLPNAGGNALLNKIKKGMAICPPGSLGMVDVNDVSRFIGILLTTGIEQERYILNAESLTYVELFKYIDQTLGRSKNRLNLGAKTLLLFGKFSGTLQRIFGINGINSDIARSAVNQSKFCNQKSLGIDGFSYRDLKDSIAEQLQKPE